MHIVIIGNGITGITAALTARKLSDHPITVISSESTYFYSRTALMYVYMGQLPADGLKPYGDWFWEEKGISLLQAHVTSLDHVAKHVLLENHPPLPYDKLLIASGSTPLRHNWPGQDLEGVQTLYGLQDVAALEALTPQIKRAVVVGGGLTGIELTEMLRTRGISVTFLVRDRHYWGNILQEEEARMVETEIRAHGVDLRLETNLEEIKGPDRVRAVRTSSGDEIPCEVVGITAGVRPTIGFLENSGIATRLGVLVNQYLETNVEGIYAAGDCAEFAEPEPGQVPVEQLWYTGRMQGETVAHTICGNRTPYTRGVWFNSAKFFRIEYQAYGKVVPDQEAGEKSFFWAHPDGTKSIRLHYAATGQIVGFTLLGIRYRHAVCERWIREGRDLGYVVSHLGEANFDPEFHRRHEQEVFALYQLKKGNGEPYFREIPAGQRGLLRSLWPFKK